VKRITNLTTSGSGNSMNSGLKLLTHVTPAYCFISFVHEHLWRLPILSVFPSQMPVPIGLARNILMVFSHYSRSIKVLDIGQHQISLLAERDRRTQSPSPHALAATVQFSTRHPERLEKKLLRLGQGLGNYPASWIPRVRDPLRSAPYRDNRRTLISCPSHSKNG
jgi:hypothetical protein